MKKNVLGIGIVGLGRILPRHLDDSIKQINGLKLVAVCDKDEKVAKTLAKKENVPYYTRYQDLVNDANVDVVSVLTPNYLHFEIGMYTAKNGKHCVMEKPIALNYKQALQLVNAFKRYKRTLMPVLQNRYNPPARITKEYVKQGKLGKILTAVLSIQWTRPQEYYDESPWKGKKNLDGGSLVSQAIHYIDIMQWILGRAKSIAAKIDTVGHNIEVEDIANAILDLKTGTRVSFDFTVCTYPHNLGCALTILGEQGTIKIGGLAMNKIDIWKVKDTPLPYVPNALLPNIYAEGMYAGSIPNHRLIYDNLVNVLLKGKKSFIKPEDALESLKIIDGIIKSSNARKEIFLK